MTLYNNSALSVTSHPRAPESSSGILAPIYSLTTVGLSILSSINSQDNPYRPSLVAEISGVLRAQKLPGLLAAWLTTRRAALAEETLHNRLPMKHS